MLIKNTSVERQHPWPEDMLVQGGSSGLVVVRNGENYYTAFVEAFPPNSFIRGEGETVQLAEDACWEKYLAFTGCEHDWVAGRYTNGGGICSKCKQFGSRVFTPVQLGQYCKGCGMPTYWQQDGEGNFWCEECAMDPYSVKKREGKGLDGSDYKRLVQSLLDRMHGG